MRKKFCKCCDEEKPINQFFNLFRRGKKSKQSKCKSCQLKYSKNYYHKKNRKVLRRKYTLQKYGLTPEQYDKILEKQNNVCKICQKQETQVTKGDGQPKLAVDHCKFTGKIRGLLCAQCNQGIGKFNHDTELLNAAIGYLNEKDRFI